MKNQPVRAFFRLAFTLIILPFLQTACIEEGGGGNPGTSPSGVTLTDINNIETVKTYSISDVAVAWVAPNGQRQILIHPGRFYALPPLVQEFVMQHETGHHALGHTDRIAFDGLNTNTPWIRQGLELEADCYAARMVSPEAARAAADYFTYVQGAQSGSPNHPPGTVRANKILACNGGYQ